MIKVLRNQLFDIPERGDQWFRNMQCMAWIIKYKYLMIISKKRLLNTYFIFIISYSPLLAQSNLTKAVNIGAQKQESIAHLLKKISAKQNFSFTYNNKVVPADSLFIIECMFYLRDISLINK